LPAELIQKQNSPALTSLHIKAGYGKRRKLSNPQKSLSLNISASIQRNISGFEPDIKVNVTLQRFTLTDASNTTASFTIAHREQAKQSKVAKP